MVSEKVIYYIFIQNLTRQNSRVPTSADHKMLKFGLVIEFEVKLKGKIEKPKLSFLQALK